MRGFRLRRLDVLLPALVAFAGIVEIVGGGYEPRAPAIGTFVVAAGLLAFARALSLVLPPLVAGVYASAPLLGFDVSQPLSWLPLLAFTMFLAGLYAPRSWWPAGLASVLLALAMSYAGLTWFTDFDPSLLFGLIMSVGPWVLGVGLRESLDRERRAGAEAERARREAVLAGERAVTAERERIAAELRDLLAHSLGAMVVQCSAAGDLVRRDAAEAARRLERVAQAGREGLAETGRLLRLLRDDRDELGLGLAASPRYIGAPARRRSLRSVRYHDLLLPGLFGVLATGEIVSHEYRPLWGSLAACWLAVVVLCTWRVFALAMPIAVTGIAVSAGLLGANTDEPASWILLGALAYYAAGRHVPRSRVLLGLASVLGSIALLLLETVARSELAADLTLDLTLALAPWAVGVALREALDRTRLLAREAEGARLERELEGERAAATERKRIARDLHDVLANSLSVMTVQASLAADLVREHPECAAAAVAEVERSGRAALGETGRLLRLIGAAGDTAGTRPQPGVADLRALTSEYARAGLAIDLETDTVERLPAAIDLSIYRIVQEALTNALKHAPGSEVHVRVARGESEVAIEVVNGRPPSNGRPPVPSGQGLKGLRERVSLFGGTLDAHATAEGGFLLAATIPVIEAE